MSNKPEPKLRTLALGWGIQSTTLLFMAALRDCGCATCVKWNVPGLEPLDVALHSDTTHERKATYEYRARWEPVLTGKGFEILTLQPYNSNTTRRGAKSGQEYILIPAYIKDEETGQTGKVIRQCTGDWKIDPQNKATNFLLKVRGIKKTPGVVEKWLGISWDEFQRAKDSSEKHITHRYPLLERRMTRQDCVTWLKAHNIEIPPKSACTFCPFMRDSAWQEMKRENGTDWQQAVAVDHAIRNVRSGSHAHIKRGGQLFLHRSCKPLEEAIQIPEDFGYEQNMLIPLESDETTCDSGHCFL